MKNTGFNPADTAQFESASDMLRCVEEVLALCQQNAFKGKTWEEVAKISHYTIPQLKVAMTYATGQIF
jgi:hypothetical protein